MRYQCGLGATISRGALDFADATERNLAHACTGSPSKDRFGSYESSS